MRELPRSRRGIPAASTRTATAPPTTAPPLALNPTPIFDPATVQHVDVTARARHVPGQTQGSVLLQTDRVRQMLMAVPAGLTMPRHRATCDVTITVAAGTGSLPLDGAEAVALHAGVHLFLPAGTAHAVAAATDLTLVVTFTEAAPEIQFISQ